ncbi:MAG: sucrase ferredoxin, partial [Pyrinomonadaceae bacterium]
MLNPLVHRHFFCSDLSRQAGENLFGTGVTAETFILLEYPGGWEPRAITDSTLPDQVKDQLEELTRPPLRAKTLLIKQDRKYPDHITLFVVSVREQDSITYRIILESYEQMLDLDLRGLAAGRLIPGSEIVDHPLFLVCTHGRHDKCCAKFGFPTYKLMKEHEPEGTWQVSHVGGDRFASNVVCFPHGIYYGHVSPADAISIIYNYRRGVLNLKNYRGRACFGKESQAAEYFVRTASGITELGALSLSSIAKFEGELRWTAHYTS